MLGIMDPLSLKSLIWTGSSAKSVELVWLWIWKTFYLLLTKLLKIKVDLWKWKFCGQAQACAASENWILQMELQRPCTGPCAEKFRVITPSLPALVQLSGDLDLLAFRTWLSPCSSCCTQWAGWEEEWLRCTMAKKGSCLKCLKQGEKHSRSSVISF